MNATFIISILLTILTCPLKSFSYGTPSEKTITIKNSSDKVGYFYYFDKYNDMMSLTIPVQSTHQIVADMPVILYAANQEKTSYILYYQDALELVFENGRHYFKSNNKQSAETANLLLALDENLREVLGKRLGSEIRIYEIMLSVPSARDSLLSKAYSIDSDYIQSYFLQRNQDLDLVAYVNQYLKYNYLMERSKHLKVKAFVNNKVPVNYKSSLIKMSEDLTCDSCINVYPYRRFAYYYLDYITANVPLESQIDYISRSFSGKTKDFMLFSLFHNYANSSPQFFKTNINNFLNIVQDPDYRKYITNLNRDDHNGMLAKDLEIYNLNGEAFSFADLIERNAGKNIYIDFWASWCSPCIDEFPSSLLLAKKYANKDIAFIYVSLDKNRNLWESAMKRLGINQKESFLIPTAFSSKLASRFKISSIPRYILIGKNGMVIHSDELRPGDPKLLTKLDQLLYDNH
jgi:thiol-disulfide isomerase/thioredoxin